VEAENPMSLISERERHLKWGALDPLEAVLYIGCGASIIGFSVSVLLDVITRQIGHPWLWLQQLTTGAFTYGIFIGMALAARRNEHMYLTEIVQAMHGSKRLTVELFARLVVLAVAACMVIFGWQNFLLDMGSYRMPSLIPLGYYTIIVPISGALIGLFQVEQMVNGLKNGFDHDEHLMPEGIE
jgi:TRAP-type C4-dicarboxylate transport system permease small subunit